ncbi:MAG: IS630 family transposase [Thermoguttaceae bacterium]
MVNENAIACVRDKFNFLRSIMDKRMRRRWAATEAMSLGWGGVTTVAQATGLSQRTLYRGIYELKDTKSLDGEKPNMPVRRSGRPCKLTNEQVAALEKLLREGATSHGWSNEVWTRKRVAVVIRRHFKVTLGQQSISKLLKRRLGWSLQKPTRQLRDRDDLEIERWLTEEYPRILARAARRRAYLAFIDETGFMLSPTLRRTYAPRGKQPVIRTGDPHARISVIGAMTISPKQHHFSFQFHLAEENVNFHGCSIVPFVDTVYRTLAGPLTIIWDGIRIHSAKPLADYLFRHRDIVVESFPAGASEVNPADKVWGYVKFGRLPNYAPPGLKSLRGRIRREFSRLQGRPDLLESMFHRTGLTLDPKEPIKTSWTPDGRLIAGEHRRKRSGLPS